MLREAFSGRSGQPETMSISTITTIASNWLSHRLGRFQMQHPELAVRLDTDDKVVDFARQDVDVALRYGFGDWEGLVSHQLYASDLTPILAPSLLDKYGPLNEPADVIPLPWLNNRHRGWDGWLKMHGIAELSCSPSRRMEFEAQAHLPRSAGRRRRGAAEPALLPLRTGDGHADPALPALLAIGKELLAGLSPCPAQPPDDQGLPAFPAGRDRRRGCRNGRLNRPRSSGRGRPAAAPTQCFKAQSVKARSSRHRR